MKCERDSGFEHVNSPCALTIDLQPSLSSLHIESRHGKGMYRWTECSAVEENVHEMQWFSLRK